MKRLLALLLVLVAGGCGTGTPDATVTPSAPAGSASSRTAVPQPRFADLTRGSTTSVVLLHGYDARNASAVVEPMIFMTADAYCRTFKIKRTDSRCLYQPYITEKSNTRVTVPIAADVKYYTWEGSDGNVCVDAPEKGGTCPMTPKQFAAWAKLNRGAMVAVATADGALTRMAVFYTP